MKRNPIAVLFFLAALGGALPASAVTCQNNIPPSNPDSAYTVHGDGTATDTRTGLMWKVCAEGQIWSNGACTGAATGYTWADALSFAGSTVFAGHSDWRLPNVKELRSLVEECREYPSINDSVFPATPSSYFWSSSPHAVYSGSALLVFFGRSFVYESVRNYYAYKVRLVRGGQ